MTQDDPFLRNVPRFLRRIRDTGPLPPLTFPAAPIEESGNNDPQRPARARTIHGGQPPVSPYGGEDGTSVDTASPQPAHGRRGLPWLARKTSRAGPEDDGEQGDVVDLTVHRAGTHPPANGAGNARGLQTELECAFADAPGDATNETVAEDEDDVAFQVTLPRSVIRQIRLRAAQEETTHRAIVLRALRASGLSIPEGADVDRRAVAARRRQQA